MTDVYLGCMGNRQGRAGGEAYRCGAHILSGMRYCFRCHLIQLSKAHGRIEEAERSLARAKHDLALLLNEASLAVGTQ